MKRRIAYIIHFLILLFALFLQSSPLMLRISVSGARPNIVFMALFVLSLYIKQNEALTLAFLIGSFADLVFGDIYGIYTLLFMGFVIVFFLLNRFILSESYFTVFVYALLASALFEGFFMLINFGDWKMSGILGEMAECYIIKIIYDALTALPIYAIVTAVHKRAQEVHRR